MNKPLLKWPVWFSSCLWVIGVKLAGSHLCVQPVLHMWWGLVVVYVLQWNSFCAYCQPVLESRKRLEGKSSARMLRFSEVWKVMFRNCYLPIYNSVVRAWGNASHLEVVSDLLCLLSSHSFFYKIIRREVEVQNRCASIVCKSLLVNVAWYWRYLAEERAGSGLKVHSSQYASNLLLQAGPLF